MEVGRVLSNFAVTAACLAPVRHFSWRNKTFKGKVSFPPLTRALQLRYKGSFEKESIHAYRKRMKGWADN